MLRASGLALLMAVFPAAWGQDLERGKILYETHCATCHSERLHHRDKSKIKTLADLRDEVARWAPQTKHGFTLDEREAVVQYLNASHYRRAAK
jgi:mono/diheme cytochrome c family protein